MGLSNEAGALQTNFALPIIPYTDKVENCKNFTNL